MRRLLLYTLAGLSMLILVIAIISYVANAGWQHDSPKFLAALVVSAVGAVGFIRTTLEIPKIVRELRQKRPAAAPSISQSFSAPVTQTEPQNVIANTLQSAKIPGPIIENQDTQNLTDSIPSPLFSIPDPPTDFTGRRVELNDSLRDVESRGLIIAGQSGSGGVGKAPLAYKIAQSVAPRYPDAQIYLDLRGSHEQQPLSPAEAMSYVVHAYHPNIKLPEDEIELGGMYRSVLQKKQALLLMENARNRQQVEPLIPPTGCLLLVTSHQHFTLPGMKTYRLRRLPPEDAEKLLLKIAPRIGEYAGKLAELCGCLPLALRVAASGLKERPDLSVPGYLSRLEEVEQRLEFTGVEASLTLSCDLLDENTQRYFRLLAVFPGSFDRPAAASVWGMEANPAREILGELLRFNLIEYNSSTRRYKLHELTRLFAGKLLEEEQREAAFKLHAGHYLQVLGTADQLVRKGGDAIKLGLALFDIEWGNIQAGHAWSVENAAQDENASRWCMDYPAAGSNIINIRFLPAQMIAWPEAAVESSRQIGDRKSEGDWLSSLGNAYHDLGQLERAIGYYQQALMITREVGDRRAEGADLSNLGLTYRDLGQLERAIEYLQQALVISREIGDLRWEDADLGSLGNAYYELGQVERAVDYHQRALAISRVIGDRRNEGSHLGNLGNAYRDLGQVERAIESYERALAIARGIGDLRGEGNRLGNLGNAYSDLGHLERAVGYYQQALSIAREIGDRSAEGNHLANLGNVYRDLGQVEQARDYLEQALRIFEEIKLPQAEQVREWLSEINSS
jgi:tetratricopeptide (TPR) repeat protein